MEPTKNVSFANYLTVPEENLSFPVNFNDREQGGRTTCYKRIESESITLQLEVLGRSSHTLVSSCHELDTILHSLELFLKKSFIRDVEDSSLLKILSTLNSKHIKFAKDAFTISFFKTLRSLETLSGLEEFIKSHPDIAEHLFESNFKCHVLDVLIHEIHEEMEDFGFSEQDMLDLNKKLKNFYCSKEWKSFLSSTNYLLSKECLQKKRGDFAQANKDEIS